MKAIAILLAGGIGSRIGTAMPKQFLTVANKPVIIHTLSALERNPQIDGIVVVCVKGWEQYLQTLLDQFNIQKVIGIVEGGINGHGSTKNALFFLKDKIAESDIVLVHDAVRPILPQQVLNDLLKTAKEHGNAVAAACCYETLIFTEDGRSGDRDLSRDAVVRAQTPQAYCYGTLLSLYENAERDGIDDFEYANRAMIHYGKRLYFSQGFANNIKITKKEDLPLCEALMQFSEEQLCQF